MIGWIIRRRDPRAAYALLVLAFPLALLHRCVWGLAHCARRVVTRDFYARFIGVYAGFMLVQLERIESRAP